MRYVKLSQAEFSAIRKLYESVMAYACHGLFFREGLSIADSIVTEVERGEDLFSGVRRILVTRGWVEDIQFTPGQARVRGSIEVTPGTGSETCHRLRGILARVHELQLKRRVSCTEVECESAGRTQCLFKTEVT